MVRLAFSTLQSEDTPMLPDCGWKKQNKTSLKLGLTQTEICHLAPKAKLRRKLKGRAHDIVLCGLAKNKYQGSAFKKLIRLVIGEVNSLSVGVDLDLLPFAFGRLLGEVVDLGKLAFDDRALSLLLDGARSTSILR